MKSTDSTRVISDKGEILQRWQQHFRDLNTSSSVTDEALDRVMSLPQCDNMDMTPSLDEVSAAIKAMKNGKAPGPDGIPAEVYKHGGVKLHRRLCMLFVSIWQTEEIPKDFKDASIVTIYKRKGDKLDCGNCRGISLLSIAGKVLARILFNRLLDNVVGRVLSESQCGFRLK
jgi:hypothetical protein